MLPAVHLPQALLSTSILMDAAYLVLTIALILASLGFIVVCERLMDERS